MVHLISLGCCLLELRLKCLQSNWCSGRTLPWRDWIRGCEEIARFVCVGAERARSMRVLCGSVVLWCPSCLVALICSTSTSTVAGAAAAAIDVFPSQFPSVTILAATFRTISSLHACSCDDPIEPRWFALGRAAVPFSLLVLSCAGTLRWRLC